MAKPRLKIENASICFDRGKLFSHLNLELYPYEMQCITGESGKGKTSLLNAILGFVPLCEGNISIDGIPLQRNTIGQIRRRISWIPQELFIPVDWVSEMVQIPFKLRANKEVRFSKEKLLKSFDFLGLNPDLLNRRVTEISGGQRQRIMIATTALLEKPLMIIDEPTSALDAASVTKVIDFLHLQTAKGKAILAVTHDAVFAESCDKRIYL